MLVPMFCLLLFCLIYEIHADIHTAEENRVFQKQCGRQPHYSSPQFKSLGGTPSKSGEYPWIAEIYVNDEPNCSGFLISPRYVLTAAHCVTTLSKEVLSNATFTLKIGGDCLFPYNCTGQTIYRGVSVALTDYYTLDNNLNNSSSDIALIELDRSMPKEEWKLLCVPKEYTKVQNKLSGVGYGYDLLKKAFLLQSYELALLEERSTLLILRWIGEHLQFPDSGDSGGPLFQQRKNGQLEAVGVSSRGANTSWVISGYAGTTKFTNVKRFSNWICFVSGICSGKSRNSILTDSKIWIPETLSFRPVFKKPHSE